jgi:hypothetical protein
MKLFPIINNLIIEMSKKKLPDGGDCFDSSFDFMLKNMYSDEYPNLKLVHSVVSGHGELSGYRFTHAWCEDDEWVYDNANNKTAKIPKFLYYSIGNVNPNQGKYYDKNEVNKMIEIYKTKGPWEIENKFYKQKFNPKTGYYN